MMRLVILAAAFGLGASHAVAACDFHRSASKVDTTKVASVSTEDVQKMSTPASQPSTVIIKDDKAAPVASE